MNTHHSTSPPPHLLASGRRDSLPTREEVAECAYELWLQHGCPENLDIAIWLDAEALLRAGGTRPLADYRELCRHK